MSRAALAACAGKARHASRAEAERVLRTMPKDGRGRAGVFGCPHCGGWHVGHGADRLSRGRPVPRVQQIHSREALIDG